VRQAYPTYHARPVPGWGHRQARLTIVGLAPGMHGANRSGRPFVGDASGRMLFDVLHETGFSTTAEASTASLKDTWITNAVKCLPPGNRPVTAEVRNCQRFLVDEIDAKWRPRMRKPRVVLCLGRIAFSATTAALAELALDTARCEFAHGAEVQLHPSLWLLSSFHPSRQNVNTGRLTRDMLLDVLVRARELLAD